MRLVAMLFCNRQYTLKHPASRGVCQRKGAANRRPALERSLVTKV